MKKKIFVFLNAAIAITIITLLSKIFGFLREVVLANRLGVSNVSDSFLLAISFPQILYASFTLAVGINFVPVYVSIKNKKDALDFYKILQVFMFLFSFIVFAIFCFFNKTVVSIFSPGSNLQFIELTSKYAMISMVSVLFVGYINISISKFNTENKPLIGSLSPIITSVFTIAAFLIFGKNHIEVILYIIVASYFFQFISIKYYLEKNESKNTEFRTGLRKSFYKSKKNLILLFKRSIPTMFSTYVDQLLPFFERFFVSYMLVGSLTYLNYSHRLNGLLLGIIGSLIISLFYPSLTKAIHKSFNERSETIYNGLLKIIVFSVPLTLYMVFNSEKIVSFLFEGGLFNKSDVEITAQIFTVFLIGGFFNIIRSFLNIIFFANMNTKDPFVGSLVMIVTFLITLNVLKETTGIDIVIVSIVEVFSFLSALIYIIYRSIKLRYFLISINVLFFNLTMTILLFVIFHILFDFFVFKYTSTIELIQIPKIDLGIQLFINFLPCVLSIFINLKLVRNNL